MSCLIIIFFIQNIGMLVFLIMNESFVENYYCMRKKSLRDQDQSSLSFYCVVCWAKFSYRE